MDSTGLVLGGYWSAYWYNGHIIGSEVGRGIDVLELESSEHLSQNEIDAAERVRFHQFNPQSQPKLVWPASFVVARAYLDQLVRNRGIQPDRATAIARDLDRAEQSQGEPRRAALAELATRFERDAQSAPRFLLTSDNTPRILLSVSDTNGAGGGP